MVKISRSGEINGSQGVLRWREESEQTAVEGPDAQSTASACNAPRSHAVTARTGTLGAFGVSTLCPPYCPFNAVPKNALGLTGGSLEVTRGSSKVSGQKLAPSTEDKQLGVLSWFLVVKHYLGRWSCGRNFSLKRSRNSIVASQIDFSVQKQKHFPWLKISKWPWDIFA